MRPGILILLLTLRITLFSQDMRGENVNEAMKGLREVLYSNDSIWYVGQMRFKGFEADTFEERNFIVHYKSNRNNLLYGYDFEIAEVLQQGDTLTYMVLDSALYVIYSKARHISKYILPEKVDLGSYLEYIRYFFILGELFSSFIHAKATDISLKESSNQYTLSLHVNEIEVQELVLNKNSFLPVKYVSTIKDADFGFDQITEIYFSFTSSYNKFHNAAFSPGDYFSSGYGLSSIVPEVESKNAVSFTFSADKQAFLLNYPFVQANGDTIRIVDNASEYYLLDFWFASCLPCLKALPELNMLPAVYPSLDLKILGINCLDAAGGEHLEEQIRKKNISMPLLFGPRTLLEDLGITTFPSYYLVFPNHNVEYITGGIEQVKEVLEKLSN